MLRAIIFMLHQIVKGLAERTTDHELLKRSLDVYEIDSDGADVMTIYAVAYKRQREYLIALMQRDYSAYRGAMSKSDYYLHWLSRFDTQRDPIGVSELSKVTWNSGSRNFDTFSDDNTFRGVGVKIPIARARVKVAAAKRQQTEVRGYQRSKRHHTF
jgi:hypothetical protein